MRVYKTKKAKPTNNWVIQKSVGQMLAEAKAKKITPTGVIKASSIGIDSGTSSEMALSKIRNNMKIGDTLNHGSLSFIKVLAKGIKSITKVDTAKISIKPNTLGYYVGGVDEGATLRFWKGKAHILKKRNGDLHRTEVAGYWCQLTKMDIENKHRVFIHGNKVYWDKGNSKKGTLLGYLDLKKG